VEGGHYLIYHHANNAACNPPSLCAEGGGPFANNLKFVYVENKIMHTMLLKEKSTALGEGFITALLAQDFTALETLLQPQVRFRALTPRRVCEAQTADEATAWFRLWFGDLDEIQVQQTASSQVFDRLHLNYRLRVHDVINGWRLIEQHAYAGVQDNHIADMWLICTGFRPDPTPDACSLPNPNPHTP
jgi:hypothetical protein